ncbi:MAG: potassium channel family protein [Ignavibacteriaceae bacterium]|jgi:voltage-gated potassium channel
MKFFTNVSSKSLTTSNTVLLLLVIFTIFLIPFFPIAWHRDLFSFFFTLIFLLSALAIKKNRLRIFTIAMSVVIIEWLSTLLKLSILSTVSFLANICFFDLIAVIFILQIARAKTVTPQVILESVSGYLLLGLSFAIILALITFIDPSSFSFPHLKEPLVEEVSYLSSFIYYSFVALTTLGYGDVIPLTPAAKSFSIFTAITGQMYIAIIIASLVSKYLSQKSPNN